MRRWKAHRGKIASLSFSRDGQLLASVTGSGRDIFIWDATAGELVRKLTVEDVPGKRTYAKALGLGFAPGADLLAVSRYYWVEFWDTSSWCRIAEAFAGEGNLQYEVSFGPGAKPLLAASSMSRVTVYELPVRLEPGESLLATTTWDIGNVSQVTFSCDGTAVATHTIDSVEVRNPRIGTLTRTLEHKRANYAGPVRFSPDSSRLVFCYKKAIESHPAMLGDSETGIRSADQVDGRPGLFDDFDPDAAYAADIIRYAGHTDKVWMLRYTPDGRTLISASSDGTVRLWEAATGLEMRCFDMKIGKIAAADVSPDGAIAAVGGANGEIVVFDLE